MADEVDFEKLSKTEKLRLIDDLFQEQIYPMLAMDGGGMELVSVDDFTVTVRYQGACEGCPSGFMATGDYIEYTLKTQIDPRIRMVVEGAENLA